MHIYDEAIFCTTSPSPKYEYLPLGMSIQLPEGTKYEYLTLGMSIQLPEGTKYEYLTLGMHAFRHKHTETESCATLKTSKAMPPCMAKLGMSIQLPEP